MRKDLGKQPAVFPMPVLMVAAYDEKGTVQVMNAAWGMICGMDKVALFIDEDHATTKAVRQTKAFTVSLADREHMDVAEAGGEIARNARMELEAKTGKAVISPLNAKTGIALHSSPEEEDTNE